MKEFSSCKASIQHCLEHKSFAVAHLYRDEKPMDMHIHDCYEIYFSISGGKQFLIDNSFYSIEPGDVFFINLFESHYITQIDQQVHERIVISIYPELLKELSSALTDLDYCFHYRKAGFCHKIHLNEDYQQRLIYHIHRIASAKGFGAELIERSAFTELMVMLNKNFSENRHGIMEEDIPVYHTPVDEILTYINENIDSPLSIDSIAKQFFMSSSYLCRIFKSSTGTTINKYITAKRITIAKSMLNKGASINEAFEQCGFNDYSSFYKSFTKAVGISPRKYLQYTL